MDSKLTALYSALVEDLEIVGCFLDCQQIKELPKKTQNPDVESLVSGHLAQSEFDYPLIDVMSPADRVMPASIVPFKYLSMRLTSRR